jgi:hypothetical protein
MSVYYDYAPREERFFTRGSLKLPVFVVEGNKDVARYHYGDPETLWEKSWKDFNETYSR